jgi:hypothetical protein
MTNYYKIPLVKNNFCLGNLTFYRKKYRIIHVKIYFATTTNSKLHSSGEVSDNLLLGLKEMSSFYFGFDMFYLFVTRLSRHLSPKICTGKAVKLISLSISRLILSNWKITLTLFQTYG